MVTQLSRDNLPELNLYDVDSYAPDVKFGNNRLVQPSN